MNEDTYSFGVNKEKTEEALLACYDEMLEYYEVTEAILLDQGYTSVDDFKAKTLEADMASIEEAETGTWRIDEGAFIFKRTGETTEYSTEYELDGDTLNLITDGIVCKRVK